MAEPFIATEPIFYDGVLAHDVGHEVPDEVVKRQGWESSVSRAGTKSAEKAAGTRTPAKRRTRPVPPVGTASTLPASSVNSTS